MSLKELFVLLLMCVVWGFHFVVIKTAVATVPPITYAAVRMVLVAIVLAPFLRWRKDEMPLVLCAGVSLGAVNYALMFTGISFATASASAIAVQLYAPFATILSIVFLGERIGLPRTLGISSAFVGVVIIALSEQQETVGSGAALGIGLVSLAMLFEAGGAVLIKKTKSFKPIELLAWFAVVGAVCLSLAALVLEPGGLPSLIAADPFVVIGAVLYSAVGASIVGHTSYYWLIKRLPISIVSSSAFLTTLIAVVASAALLQEPLSGAFFLGGILTVIGVGVVLFRSKASAPQPGARGAGFFRRSLKQ
ncbi:MAG: EamA family transporter [Pseudomonadota bacterium]